MKRIICLIIIYCLCRISIAAPIEIVMWHSLAGYLGLEVQHLIAEFNQSQAEFVIKPVYKGDYTDSLTSFAAAFRAKQPPALIQVFEVGTGIMLSPPGIIKPLDQLMKEQGMVLPINHFLPAIRSFYSQDERLQAMPFNISIPVIYYNAQALAKIGVNQSNFPKTWDEMEVLAANLKKAGYQCAYTSAYPAWIQIESFLALHGLPLVDLKKQHVVYDNEAIIHHLERLKRWQDKGYFTYGGRTSDATILFTSGHCVMFSQSSGSYKSLTKLVTFPVEVANLPLDDSIRSIRHNNVTGGAALWAVAGQSSATYRGIAKFYMYLAQPKVQQAWYQHTGYIPIGLQGEYLSIANDNTQYPILALAEKDLASTAQNPLNLYGIPQNQIRTINDEAMEAIFAGIKTPRIAIQEAAVRSNFILQRFTRNTGHRD